MFDSFIKGFRRGFNGKPSIEEVICRVRAQSTLEPINSDPACAVYKLSFRNHVFLACLEEDQGSVRLSVSSNSRFPLRNIHPGVEAFLLDRNKELKKCDWVRFHGESQSWPIVIGRCAHEAMDGELFMDSIRMLLEEAYALDETFRRMGLL